MFSSCVGLAMMHMVKFAQCFRITRHYFWGTWIPNKSRETLHAVLLPYTSLVALRRKQLLNECEGKQRGEATREAGRRCCSMDGRRGQRPGHPDGLEGTSKGQPRTGTDSCQGAASFAISCHFSIWLEDIFTDEVLYKTINWILNLSGFHPS